MALALHALLNRTLIQKANSLIECFNFFLAQKAGPGVYRAAIGPR